MKPLTEAELREMELLCVDVTPGPIKILKSSVELTLCGHVALLPPDAPPVAYCMDTIDARFFAAARTDLPRAIKEIRRLNSELARYKWRRISNIHEDYGPCVLMHIGDPGYLEIGSNLDTDFDELTWTHFSEVPKLSHEEAEELIDQMRPTQARESKS